SRQASSRGSARGILERTSHLEACRSLAGGDRLHGAPMSVLSFESVTLPGSDRPRLNAVSFSLDQGECAFLIGPNGAGKSSLLRLVLGLERATGGNVKLADRAVTELTPIERAARVAWLPQHLSFQDALTA